jgi:3-oxoacyl-[acyl-carrier protein] reductase
MKFAGRVAVITGAGRGIGRAIALKLGGEGASVAVSDIELAYAQNTANRIIQSGGSAIALKADVRDRDDVRLMFHQVIDKLRKVDILVNNAGIREDIMFREMNTKKWKNVLDTNLTGTLNCIQIAHKYMLNQNYGKIINISSPVPPAVGRKGVVNYAAASSGIYGLTRSLAIELGPYNINVNCIAPDFIDTEMLRKVARAEGLYLDELKKFIVATIPLRRLGSVNDVANLTSFLASDEASFITGQIIYIKGGP